MSAARDETETTGALPLVDSGTAEPTTRASRGGPNALQWAAMAGVLVLLGGVFGVYFQGPAVRAVFNWTPLEPGAGASQPIALPVERIPSAERVAAMAVGDVLALGRLRPRDGIVAVGLPVGAGDARIEELLVAQGDVVEEGARLATLDTRDQYEAALDAAETNVATRRALLAQTRVQVAVSEAETRAALESAEARLAAAKTELARAETLVRRGASSEALLDEAQSAHDTARADVAGLTATLSRYAHGDEGRQVDIAVAEAELAAAEASVEHARRDLARAHIAAPRAGAVIEVLTREGERPPADGVLRLGDIARMEVELEVFQEAAPRVALGNAVLIRSGVLGEPALTGRVARIGALVGRQNVTEDDPSANTDARVLEVIVALDAGSSPRAARFVGLEVVARIQVSDDAAPAAGDDGAEAVQ